MIQNDQAVATARHLFRNLKNASALRRNALAWPLFVGVARSSHCAVQTQVFDLVSSAVDALRPDLSIRREQSREFRHYVILKRYDFNREPRVEVERDLNIGTRQFYYERKTALARFVDAFRNLVVAQSSVNLTIYQKAGDDDVAPIATLIGLSSTDFEATFMRARKLMDLGQFEISAALLTSMAGDAAQDSERLRVLCVLIDVLWHAGDPGKASMIAGEARHLLNRATLTDNDRAMFEAQVEFASAKVSSQLGKFRDSLRIVERARSRLSSCNLADVQTQLLYAELLGWVGELQSLFGSVNEAVLTYEHAITIVENCRLPSPLLAEFLWGQAKCYSFMPGKLELAREKNAEALDIATRGGQLHMVACAHRFESRFDYWDGCLKSALSHGRLAVAISNSIAGPEERSVIALEFARVEAASGYKRAALRRIAVARIGLPPDCYAWMLSDMVESQVLLWLNNHAEALASAVAAASKARKKGVASILGSSLSLMAEAHEGTGDLKGAALAARAAIEELQSAADPFSLAVAYECSARLTGNQSHSADAADLRGIFRRKVTSTAFPR